MWSYASAFSRVIRDSGASPDRMRRVVHRRLQDVLVAAFTTVPHYRRIMQRIGYDPIRDYSGPADLTRLPVLSRDDLRSLSAWFKIRSGHRLDGFDSESSSGSTGRPLTVYRSRREQAIHVAKWMRVLFLNGYRPHQRVMAFCHPRRLNPARSAVQRLGLLRRRGVDYLLPTGRLVEELFSYRPHVLYGNRCHLELAALHMQDRGLGCDFLEMVVVTGEIVHPHSRRLIREAYGVEPVESYGSVEMGVMAHETPARDGLSLCEDQTCFEFLDDHGAPVAPGDAGRVIVTDLSLTTVPIIRYDQGDRVIFREQEHPDGGRVRRLERVIGRDDDYAVMPGGIRQAYNDLCEVVVGFDSIDQYRVVQLTESRIRVELVVAEERYAQIEDEMRCRFERLFPAPLQFEIYRVHRIEPDSSGKIRKLISAVDGGTGRPPRDCRPTASGIPCGDRPPEDEMEERRSGEERRSKKDRRSGTDRRRNDDAPWPKERERRKGPDRRLEERRSGGDRRKND